jgi:hypothetical protein
VGAELAAFEFGDRAVGSGTTARDSQAAIAHSMCFAGSCDLINFVAVDARAEPIRR